MAAYKFQYLPQMSWPFPNIFHIYEIDKLEILQQIMTCPFPIQLNEQSENSLKSLVLQTRFLVEVECWNKRW